MKNPSTSWGKVAEWYDDMLETEAGTYQKEVILPNLLRMLDIQQGEPVLEIGCGQGLFTRAFAEAGAKAVGADISPELIALAKKHAPQLAFHAAPAHALTFAQNGGFKKAAIILALQNIAEMGAALAEAARTLEKNGSLFIVLNHPAFRIPKHSAWGFDEEGKQQYRRIDRYLSEIRIPIVMHPGAPKSAETVSFHRPLQLYFKELRKAGFAVTRLEEWISHKKSQKGPRSEAEDIARKEIPLFLCLEAKKL